MGGGGGSEKGKQGKEKRSQYDRGKGGGSEETREDSGQDGIVREAHCHTSPPPHPCFSPQPLSSTFSTISSELPPHLILKDNELRAYCAVIPAGQKGCVPSEIL